MTEGTDRIAHHLGRTVLFAAVTLLLVGSWYVLLVLLRLKTIDLLAPYADCPLRPELLPGIPPRPPFGTWQRSLNDLFERAPGSYLPGVLLVASTAVPLLRTAFRRKATVRLLLGLAASNLLFLFLYAIAEEPALRLPLLWLPQPRPSSDLGYHRTWPGIVLLVVLSALLISLQWQLRRWLSTGEA